MLHHSQLGGLTLPDKGAFGDQCTTNAPGDRGRYSGITQIDAGSLNIGFGNCNIRFGLFLSRNCVGILLLAHRIGFYQRLVTFGQSSGLRYVGLGTGLTGFGAGRHGSIGR